MKKCRVANRGTDHYDTKVEATIAFVQMYPTYKEVFTGPGRWMRRPAGRRVGGQLKFR